MFHMCVNEIKGIKFFCIAQEEMANVCADFKHRLQVAKDDPETRNNHHFIQLSCSTIAKKLKIRKMSVGTKEL